MSYATIRPEQLHKKCESGEAIELLDVRTPVEFREVHATTAKNLPLDSLDPRQFLAARNGKADQPLYIICHKGSRAAKACEKFVAAGFGNVVNVAGGTEAWDAAGLPVRRGKKAMSLERQVRIVAGLLVFVGAVLGYLLHPAWVGLCAFVGAGLMFAGVTDTCAMGMLIAKMPWNQCGEGDRCST